MEKTFQIITIILAIIGIYIISTVGLDIGWKIGKYENANKYNNVLINLSYSYIAGYIFYLLTVYFPYFLKKKKVTPILNQNLNLIHEQINSIVQTFYGPNDINIDLLSRESLLDTINITKFDDQSYFSTLIGVNISHVEHIKFRKPILLKRVANLLEYKDYLSSSQILSLERIRNTNLFNLLIDNPIREHNNFRDSENFKTSFFDELVDLISSIRQARQ